MIWFILCLFGWKIGNDLVKIGDELIAYSESEGECYEDPEPTLEPAPIRWAPERSTRGMAL